MAIPGQVAMGGITAQETKLAQKRLRSGGLAALVERWIEGYVTLVDGDALLLPGISVFAAKDTHTPGSQ